MLIVNIQMELLVPECQSFSQVLNFNSVTLVALVN